MKRIAIAVIALITAATSAHAATRITVGSGGNGSASVPVATTSTAGKVRPDGSTITVETDGTIHAAATGNVTLGTTNGLSLSGQVLSLSAATDSTAGAMSAADHAAMPTTLAKLVAIELAAAPRKIYMVYGDSTDGGDTPDSTTQASIDALLDAGVPQANIRWVYEVDDTNTFTIANLTDSTTIENVVLTQHGGTFAVADMGSATAIDNVTISSGDVLVFAVADLAAATTIDNVVLSLAGGTLAVADMASATTTENVVLAAGTSAPTTPVISVTPGDSENVIALTSGGTGATSYDIKWGTTAGSRTNTIDWATIQAATSPDFPASAYIHTGRTNGTTYYYSLVATNAGGSTESAEVSGTTVVADSFTGANGTAPNAALWDVVSWANTGNSHDSLDAINIQSNQLRVYLRKVGSNTNVSKGITSHGAITRVNGMYVSVDIPNVTFDGSIAGTNLYELAITPAQPTQYVGLESNYFRVIALGDTVSIRKKVGGATTTLFTEALAAGTTLNIKMVLVDATNIEVFVNGVSKGTYAHGLSLSTFYATLEGVSDEDTAYQSLLFDNFLVAY